MKHNLSDCTIEVPTEWQDRSINVFVCKSDGNSGSNIAISRREFVKGMTLESYIEEDLANLQRIPNAKIKITRKEKGTIDGRQSQFIEMSNVLNGTYSEQMALYIDNNGDGICAVFTYPTIIDDSLRKTVTNILNSLKFK